MGILKGLRLIIVSILEESGGNNWRYWRPENEILQPYKYLPDERFKS